MSCASQTTVPILARTPSVSRSCQRRSTPARDGRSPPSNRTGCRRTSTTTAHRPGWRPSNGASLRTGHTTAFWRAASRNHSALSSGFRPRVSKVPPPLLAEPGGQPAEELAAADHVEDEDRQRREDDRREHGGHVDAVLALERP